MAAPPPRPPRRRARRLAVTAGAVLVALAAVLGVIAFFVSRDDATFTGAAGPGRLEPDRGAGHLPVGRRGGTPPGLATSGPHRPEAVERDGVALTPDQRLHALELGDVVLVTTRDADLRPLRRLGRELAGRLSPSLAAAGQAVLVDVQPPGAAGPGVTALAWRRRETAPGPRDPRLRAFVEAWLGRGAPG